MLQFQVPWKLWARLPRWASGRLAGTWRGALMLTALLLLLLPPELSLLALLVRRCFHCRKVL